MGSEKNKKNITSTSMGSEKNKKNKSHNGHNDKNKNKSGGGGGGREQAERTNMITDERFASAQTDPRFMEAPKKKSKVEIDSRFDRLFTDRSFASSKASIDKRGKPRSINDNKSASYLKHHYRLQQQQEDRKKTKVEEEGDDDDDDEEESESESEKLKTTLDDEDDEEERSLEESSSTDTADSDSDFMEEDDDVEDALVPQEENVPETDNATRRLAIVNLDWSHIRAVDIYVLLTSFLPKGGQIMSVAVYPSDFGLKRMEEEAVSGPTELFGDENEHDTEDDDELDKKKLRAYELSRLRYYYAVVECDSSATGDYLYKTCDGVEFERSANKLDLRFIPDSMTFKHHPRDVATEAPANYEGLEFHTRALQHSNIDLLWDVDEPQRAKTLKRILNSDEPDESDLKEILASDESESEEDDKADGTEDRVLKKQKRLDTYRALINRGNDSDEDSEEDNEQDMEVTFNSGLEDISKRILEQKDKKSETVWEANLRKQREKKKARKNRSKYSSEDESDESDRELGEQPNDFFVEETSDNQVHSTKIGSQETVQEAEASRAELELLLADDMGTDTKLKSFSLKHNKKGKGKKGKEIPEEENLPTIDYSDTRFSSLLSNPLFALDPTDPQFKRSAANSRQITKKRKVDDPDHARPIDNSVISVPTSEMHEREIPKHDTSLAQRNQKHELSSLIKSIKMKSKQVALPSEGKVHKKNSHKARIQK